MILTFPAWYLLVPLTLLLAGVGWKAYRSWRR
jgi:hypothetical protein